MEVHNFEMELIELTSSKLRKAKFMEVRKIWKMTLKEKSATKLNYCMSEEKDLIPNLYFI